MISWFSKNYREMPLLYLYLLCIMNSDEIFTGIVIFIFIVGYYIISHACCRLNW